VSEITYIVKGQSLADLSIPARMATDNLLSKKGRTLSYACYGQSEATARFVSVDGQLAIKLVEKAI
jgi:hypothetical protein